MSFTEFQDIFCHAPAGQRGTLALAPLLIPRALFKKTFVLLNSCLRSLGGVSRFFEREFLVLFGGMQLLLPSDKRRDEWVTR